MFVCEFIGEFIDEFTDGLSGGLSGEVAPTLSEAGGEFRRIVGLLTARICCLAVRVSDSLVFAAAVTFFSEALGSLALVSLGLASVGLECG